MALTKIGATLGGSADVITVTQNSHGLTLGYPVKMTSSGYAHATADSAANAEVVGIIIATTTNTLTIALGGRITVDGCVPNVTAGTVLFLQVSAGLLAATEPSSAGQISKPMAVVTVANSEMIMVQQRGEVISTGGASIADESITNAKLSHMAANTVKVRDANSSGDPSDKAVADTQILIGDGTGFTAAALSGDVTMANTGAVTIATDAVDIAMLSATGTASNSTFLRGDNAWAAPSSGPSQAVEADIESETNQDTYIPPDLAKHIPGAAKFWCDILLAGSLTGTDYNVASITDNAVGYRTVVYTTAMAESNYPVQVTNRGHTNYASSPFTETHTTSGMDIRIRRTESSYALMDERNNVTGYGLA